MAFCSVYCRCCTLLAAISVVNLQFAVCRTRPEALRANLSFRTFKADAKDVRTMAFSPDGSLAATGHWNNVTKLWKVATGALLHQLDGHEGVVLAVAFSPGSSTLLTGSSDSSVKLWNVATGTELRTLPEHTGWVTSVAFAPGGKHAVTGANDGTVRLFDITSGRLLRNWEGAGSAAALSVTFNADGSKILTGFNNNSAIIFDVAGPSEEPSCKRAPTGLPSSCSSDSKGLNPLRLVGHTGWVVATAVIQDAALLLTGAYDGTAAVWNASSGKRMQTLRGHKGSVTAVAFSPSGRSVLTGGRDGVVRAWDSATGDVLLTFGGKAKKKREKGRRAAPPPHGSSITTVAFMPEGLTALVGYMSPGKPYVKPVDPELAQCRERCGETNSDSEKIPVLDLSP